MNANDIYGVKITDKNGYVISDYAFDPFSKTIICNVGEAIINITYPHMTVITQDNSTINATAGTNVIGKNSCKIRVGNDSNVICGNHCIVEAGNSTNIKAGRHSHIITKHDSVVKVSYNSSVKTGWSCTIRGGKNSSIVTEERCIIDTTSECYISCGENCTISCLFDNEIKAGADLTIVCHRDNDIKCDGAFALNRVDQSGKTYGHLYSKAWHVKTSSTGVRMMPDKKYKVAIGNDEIMVDEKTYKRIIDVLP